MALDPPKTNNLISTSHEAPTQSKIETPGNLQGHHVTILTFFEGLINRIITFFNSLFNLNSSSTPEFNPSEQESIPTIPSNVKILKSSKKSETPLEAQKEKTQKVIETLPITPDQEFAIELNKQLDEFTQYLKAADPNISPEKYQNFFSAVTDFEGGGYIELIKDTQKCGEIWKTCRPKVFDLAMKIHTENLSKKKVTFIDGTASPTIALMVNIAKNRNKNPVLKPTGKLLKKNIAPITGELIFGIRKNGVNQSAISGMSFSYHGIRICQKYSDPLMYGKLRLKDEIKLIECIADKEEISNKKNFMSPLKNLERLKIAVLRILTLTTVSDENKKHYKEFFAAFLRNINELYPGEFSDEIKEIQEIEKLFDGNIQPYQFDETEQSFIDSPFPIIFASTSLTPTYFRNGVLGEVIIKSKIKLGEDIQFAFTNTENIEKLQKVLLPYEVHVFDIAATTYLLES